MTLSIDLSGKKAFVTGVTDGIGAGIAEFLAKAGCDVAGCGRRSGKEAGAIAFLKSVEEQQKQVHYFSGDLAHKEEPARLVRQAATALGGIDILVSNAGRNVFRGVEECTERDWQECLDLDLASHWRLAQAAKPFLEQDSAEPGVILLIASNHAWNTIPGCFPYNVAKAGMLGLVQSLAIEWGPRIRTVGIAPGFIDTPGNQIWFDSFPDPAAERLRTEKMHPVGRMGNVAEIATLCAFLVSPWGGFVSGTTLIADGGRSALMQDSGKSHCQTVYSSIRGAR
jgi:NAD(P)-dependent dehydrogenase (short-subunit alcohol dehydrogenase family)